MSISLSFISPSLWKSLWVYFSLWCFLLNFLLIFYIPERVPNLLDSSFNSPSLSTWRKMGRVIYTLFYIWQSVWPQPFTSLLYFKFSLVKEDRNPPSTSFPEFLWEGYSRVATATLVVVIVETSYLSGTLYPSLHKSPRYPIWRVWIITFYHYTEGETETTHGHMAYPTLQSRTFIQTYIQVVAMEYA